MKIKFLNPFTNGYIGKKKALEIAEKTGKLLTSEKMTLEEVKKHFPDKLEKYINEL